VEKGCARIVFDDFVSPEEVEGLLNIAKKVSSPGFELFPFVQ
jgi:hypothetical protein